MLKEDTVARKVLFMCSERTGYGHMASLGINSENGGHCLDSNLQLAVVQMYILESHLLEIIFSFINLCWTQF